MSSLAASGPPNQLGWRRDPGQGLAAFAVSQGRWRSVPHHHRAFATLKWPWYAPRQLDGCAVQDIVVDKMRRDYPTSWSDIDLAGDQSHQVALLVLLTS